MSVIQKKMMTFANSFLLTRDSPLIVDIGAYNGKVIKGICSGLLQYQAYAIEACPKNYKLLKKNVCNDSGIIPLNIAIASYSGDTDFYVASHDQSDGTSQANSLHKNFLKSKIWANIKKKKIKCFTLDDFCEEYDILDKIDYLKINCEGCEFDIFDSPTVDFLSETNMIYIQMHGKCKKFNSELFVEKKKNIMNTLLAKGFVILAGGTDTREQKHMEQLWIKQEYSDEYNID